MIFRKFRLLFDLSLVLFCVSALSLVFIPSVVFEKGKNVTVASAIIAAAFWTGVICGAILLYFASKKRKTIEQRLSDGKSKLFNKQLPGVITFFANKEAKAVDIVFFVFAVTVAGLTIASVQIEWLGVICIAAMLLSFVFHSFLNGINYKYITAYKKYLANKESRGNE